MSRHLHSVPPAGHTTSIRCGDAINMGLFRPQCEECDWRSGWVRSLARAREITDEHRAKTAGMWRPAK